MPNSKMIMIEGIPGSGKSTMAQTISRTLTQHGISHKWWYEEEKGHPVYIYNDYDSMEGILQNLNEGNYQLVIRNALDQWIKFSRTVQLSEQIVIVDSCLFGYLTWTLFAYNVQRHEILAYVEEVIKIISQCNPCLIHLYQENISAALHKICTRRGGETEQRFIQSATGSRFGQANSLHGFNGMVAYWEAYRTITAEAYKEFPFRKIAIDNTAGNWSKHNEEVHDFLALTNMVQQDDVKDQERLFGSYTSGTEVACRVFGEEGKVLLDGLPHSWPRAPLLKVSELTYDVESLPIQIKFEEDLSTRQIVRFLADGPELLDGPVSGVFIKE